MKPFVPFAPRGKNPETILSQVADIMTHRPFSAKKFYRVVWIHHAIRCIPAGTLDPVEIQFGRYHIDTINKGLSTDEWKTLIHNITSFLTQKGLL